MLNKEKYVEKIIEMALFNDKIALKNNKPIKCTKIHCAECGRCVPGECCSEKKLLEWANSEYKEPILDEVEKRYLKRIINPFRDKVLYIQKASIGTDNIRIGIKNDNTINLPCFKKDTMYKGMKTWEKYTLEDLGI